MKYDLQEILDLAEEKSFAIPAFNVYNLETLMGVTNAAKETNAPIIIQMYSRLFDTDTGRMLSPIIKQIMNDVKSPVAFHLDHGVGMPELYRAARFGVTGVMLDVSTLPIEENIAATKDAVAFAKELGIGVEGELGHIGSTKDEKWAEYTEVCEAVRFVEETNVDALAIMVGTAHGKYAKAPKLVIERIAEIYSNIKAHLVLHGGSGVPDDQIKAAIKAGIRKINFGTDVCYAFIDRFKELDPYAKPLDITMRMVSENVKNFALQKIKLLGADRYADVR